VPRNFNRGLVRLHKRIVASQIPWLIGGYARIRESAVYALYVPARLFRHPSRFKNNFLVYAQTRTGSTVLADLLNSNPFVRCERELFALGTVFTEAFINAKRSFYPDRAYGCKIMAYQLEQQVSPSGMHPFMLKMHIQGWKILYLTRRNVLRQALSHLLVQLGGEYYLLASDSSPLGRFNIDLDDLQHTIRKIEAAAVRDEKVLEGIPHLKLVYEDDLLQPEKHQETLNNTLTYLGLPASPVKTELRRITPAKISDFVENFEELKSFVNNTSYADFLE